MKSDEDRFWSKVDRSDPDGCWIWRFATINSGYGVYQRSRANLAGPRQVTAHRFACETVHGHLPEGAEVCHTCDNKLCVNPAHLYVGTRQDNARDAKERGLYRCPTRKLTDEQVLAIRASEARGADLAREYGVDRSAITNIRKRKRWTNI